MFFRNRFTQRAEKALNLAQQTAGELGHSYVGSEHLLAGLAKEQEGIAGRTLEQFGVTADKIIEEIEKLTGKGTPDQNAPQGLTPRTKKIIELAVMTASQLGAGYVGTEHLLMGLIREGENVALQVLSSLDVDIEKLYNSIIEAIGASSDSDMTVSKSSEKGKKSSTKTLEKYDKD